MDENMVWAEIEIYPEYIDYTLTTVSLLASTIRQSRFSDSKMKIFVNRSSIQKIKVKAFLNDEWVEVGRVKGENI